MRHNLTEFSRLPQVKHPSNSLRAISSKAQNCSAFLTSSTGQKTPGDIPNNSQLRQEGEDHEFIVRDKTDHLDIEVEARLYEQMRSPMKRNGTLRRLLSCCSAQIKNTRRNSWLEFWSLPACREAKEHPLKKLPRLIISLPSSKRAVLNDL